MTALAAYQPHLLLTPQRAVHVMSDDFSLATAEIVGFFLETLLFGINLVTFGMVMHVLAGKLMSQGLTSQRFALSLVALALFVIAALNEAIVVRHILESFVWYQGPGGTVSDLSKISYWENVLMTATGDVQTSIADAMLIYRCHIIYRKSWWIVVTFSTMWLASLAAEIGSIFFEATFDLHGLLSARILQPWLAASIVISLILNLTATTFIVIRFFQIQRRNAAMFISDGYGNKGGNSLVRALRIIIESGAIHAFSGIIVVATYLAKSNAIYTIADTIVQLDSIAFNLIIIRISAGQTIEDSDMSTTQPAAIQNRRLRQLQDIRYNPHGTRRDGLSYADDILTANLTTGASTDGTVVVQFSQEMPMGHQRPMVKPIHNSDSIVASDTKSHSRLEGV